MAGAFPILFIGETNETRFTRNQIGLVTESKAGGHFGPGGEVSDSTPRGDHSCDFYRFSRSLFLNVESMEIFLNYTTKYIFNNRNN